MIEKMLKRYRDERKNREIEKYIVESMYSAASLSSYMSFEDILKTIADSGYGVLSNEFQRAYNHVITGESPETALENIGKRTSSSILKRAVNILAAGYVTGIDLSTALREAAEDVERTLEISRENNASMTVEKYTLLVASGIMVPLILGSMISFVGGIDLSPLQELEIGIENRALLEQANLGNQIYVIIYSIMVSVFVAYREGAIENSVIYVGALLPLSIILFNLAQSGLFL